MASLMRADPWGYRLLFLGVAVVLLFVRLLPLDNTAGGFPGPDLVLCLLLAWTMRRPEYVPIWLIVAVVLLEDLILQRPPGLWTALVVLASEFLRSRIALTRELNFFVEWLLASGLMIALLLIYRFAFMLALLPQPPFGFAVVQVLWSILCYPAVVGLTRLVFELKRKAPGEVDEYGRPL